MMPVQHLRIIIWGALKQVLMDWQNLWAYNTYIQLILNFRTRCFPNWAPLSAQSSVFVCVLNLRLIFIICLCFAKRMHWCSTAWLEQTDVRHSATFSRLCNVTLPLASRAKWLKLWLIEIGVGELDWMNLKISWPVLLLRFIEDWCIWKTVEEQTRKQTPLLVSEQRNETILLSVERLSLHRAHLRRCSGERGSLPCGAVDGKDSKSSIQL